MKEYISYKTWWIDHVAPAHIPSLYWGETAEQAFKYHVQNLGVYGLMEILTSWDAE
jgi:hypothetical protein